MSTVEVKVATNNRASGPTPVTLYTVPAGKQAIVKNVNARNTVGSGTSAPILQIKRSGVSTQISTVSLLNDASANMLAAPLTMASGDVLQTIETANATLESLVLPRFPDGNNSAPVAIVDGNVIICVSNGIFRSADAGLTFTKVSNFVSPVSSAAAKIGANYFIYNSASEAFQSTDGGITWTSVAVTNAPAPTVGTRTVSPQGGRIVFNGSVYAAFRTNTSVATTTDGITWTNFAAGAPAAADSLVWTGTHWAAINGGTATSVNVYRTTDGVSWITAGLVSGLATTMIPAGLASDGNGILLTACINTGDYYRSEDHGASWTGIIPAVAFTNQRFTFISGVFFITGSSGSMFSASGAPSTFTITTAKLNVNYPFGVTATKIFFTNGGLRSAPLPLPTQNLGGMDVTASILEVTP